MSGLLEGVRVVEVALLAPNMLGMLLADMGADVVKVEEPGRGDYTRAVGAARAGGVSFLHLRWNRGKRSIAVDLRRAEGAEVFRDLVRTADIVIEGLRAGALERRGVGYDALRVDHPTLVFCSLSGFGQTGPYRDLATHGVAYDAYAGLAPPERTDDGMPTIPSGYVEVGTQAGALVACAGVLAALTRARATGEGAYIDVSQADAAAFWNAGRLDPLLSRGKTPRSESRRSMGDSVRYQYYETSDGGYILFQASERAFFENFCRAIGREDLLRHGGADVGEHAVGDVALRAELADEFRKRTQQEWVQLFLEHDVAGGPVHVGGEVLDDPQFAARDRLVEHDHAAAGHLRMLRTPLGTDAGAPPISPAPDLGEHTREILIGVLGYDASRADALQQSGVCV